MRRSQCYCQVMEHTDNLDHLERDVTSLEIQTQQLENRTSDAERDIATLSSETELLDDRVGILEQTNYGMRVWWVTNLITACQRSCCKLMFCVVSVCSQGGPHVATTYNAIV